MLFVVAQRDLALEQGGNAESTVWFHDTKLPAVLAARVNAAASDAAASDDSDMRNIAHYGTTLCSAGLALGERTRASGRDLLLAMVLGYEAGGRIGNARQGGRPGMHASQLVAFASAAISSKLLKLGDIEMAHALGIVATTVGGLLVTFLIELGVVLVILLIAGNMVLPWIPVVVVLVAIQTVMVLGIGLLLSAANVYFRDVRHFVTLIMPVLFYSTPIVYPMSEVPQVKTIAGYEIPVRTIYGFNPLVRLVTAYRDALYSLRMPSWTTLGYLALWAIGLVLVGQWVFNRLDHRLAEEV